MNENTQNRVKMISIDPRVIVDLLNWESKPLDIVGLEVTNEIPEGAVVVAVSAEWSRRSIEAIVSHPSFPEIVPGNLIPRIETTVKVVRRRSEAVDIAEKGAALGKRLQDCMEVDGEPSRRFLQEIVAFLKPCSA